jgi:hypothetical protein
MRFQMPETLDGLSRDEISKLLEAATSEATELNSIPDDKITREEIDALHELVGHMDTLAARETEIEKEELATVERLAAARARLAPAEEAASEEEAAAAAEEEAAEEEAAEEKELVTASAAKRSFTAKVGKQSKAPAEVKADPPKGALSLVAAANIGGDFVAGQELDSFSQLAEAFIGRGKSFVSNPGGKKSKGVAVSNPGRFELTSNATRHSVAKLRKADSEFAITEKMSAEDQFDLIQRVAQESRLPGGGLIAAGGWCAPSEQIWSFCELETMDGLLSIPEMVTRRGGVTWTPGPQLADMLADVNFGFIQTEAQAEAGDVKPCYNVVCPEWDEVRLDAVGFCIKAGLLTNAAYPELIRRVLALGLIAHARTINATTIARISAAIGAAVAFAPVEGTEYSSTSDLLSAIELHAIRIRETHAMAENTTVEGVFPIWLKAVIRAELSRRNGVDLLNVTDAMITSWFSTRGVAAQFVRDYQAINSGEATTPGGTAGWTRLPDEVEFMLYPAGAFVRIGTEVIDLDTVYDTDGLTQNTYTAAFFEEGFGILNACGTGTKVTVSLDNLSGLTGAAAIGAPEAIAA